MNDGKIPAGWTRKIGIRELRKFVGMATDRLAHALDIHYETAYAIQAVIARTEMDHLLNAAERGGAQKPKFTKEEEDRLKDAQGLLRAMGADR